MVALALPPWASPEQSEGVRGKGRLRWGSVCGDGGGGTELIKEKNIISRNPMGQAKKMRRVLKTQRSLGVCIAELTREREIGQVAPQPLQHTPRTR